MVGDAARPVGHAVARIGENEVDVRRDVEFAPAELTHADHHHGLRHALLVLWLAVDLALPAVEKAERTVDRHLGQQGTRGGHFGEVGEAVEVAHDEAQHDLLAHAAQCALERVFVGDGLGCQQPAHGLFVPCGSGLGEQGIEQAGLGIELAGGKGAAVAGALQPLGGS